MGEEYVHSVGSRKTKKKIFQYKIVKKCKNLVVDK